MSKALEIIDRLAAKSRTHNQKQSEIEIQDKIVTDLNIEYWQKFIPTVRETKAKLGFIPQKMQDESNRLYARLTNEREKLGNLTKQKREVFYEVALFNDSEINLPGQKHRRGF